MAVLKRVIPCLDVDAGRVVKGTNFVGLRDAGDGGQWGVYVNGGRKRVEGGDAVGVPVIASGGAAASSRVREVKERLAADGIPVRL